MSDLADRIHSALRDPSLQQAVPQATRLAAMLRRQAVEGYEPYERCRDRARAIKERAIAELPRLLEQLEQSVRAAGGQVHHAPDAAAAGAICVQIARSEHVRRIVKSKSMTTEEIHLNAVLEQAGIAVRETDLGEYIVQLDGDRPSHIIAPIIHKSLDQVRETFRKGLGLEQVPSDPEQLTQIARRQLRAEFLEADMGITGANFLIAETGTVVVVENEGNARMCTQLPRVHLVVAGIEKVLGKLVDLEPFLQLLPRSATGQLLTSYLSLISGPGWGDSPLSGGQRSFHLVLLDNGRSRMRDDELLREALYCIRCGACLNVCAPYQAVGGHVFGGPTYQSGIGVAWEAGVRGVEVAGEFQQLCSTCSRCRDVCPVRIDIPWMNAGVRQRVDGAEAAGSPLSDPRRLYALARRAGVLQRLASIRPIRGWLQWRFGIDHRRPLPRVAEVTFSSSVSTQPRSGARKVPGASAVPDTSRCPEQVVLFADCHTDNVETDIGAAALRVLRTLGFEVSVVSGPCCGRAALSQGDLSRARVLAREAVRLLEPLAEDGAQIIGIEPSCTSCLVQEHARLLPQDSGPLILGIAVRDLFQFLREHQDRIAGRLHQVQPSHPSSAAHPAGIVVLHGHCQQKTAGWFEDVSAVLGLIPGLRVLETTAECCGMAGSFGYKPDTYEVSVQLGRRLLSEISTLAAAAGADPEPEVYVCGTSCRAQLADLGGRRPGHPILLLAQALGC